MIFVCVGTQVPFDRLVSEVAAWQQSCPDVRVVAQVGKGGTMFPNLECVEELSKDKFDSLQREASLIVSHAGMGSIISALTMGIPILVMPRSASLGEHRNDHQIATAKAFASKPGVYVAWNAADLRRNLDERMSLIGGSRLSPYAPDDFLREIRKVVDDHANCDYRHTL